MFRGHRAHNRSGIRRRQGLHPIFDRSLCKPVRHICFLEFIFEQDLSEQIRIILGAVGIATLFLYLYFYQTIKGMDNDL